MAASIRVLVGLGNPGEKYELTRHNVGVRWLRALADRFAISMRLDSNRKLEIGRGLILGHDVRLVAPMTYMNRSGDAVDPLLKYFRIEPKEIVVAFDDVAFDVGTTRLKFGGGAGGHNGLKSLISSFGGNREFGRLRIGIGHPGNPAHMVRFLTDVKMPDIDRALAAQSSELADETLGWLLSGDLQRAMTKINSVPIEQSTSD